MSRSGAMSTLSVGASARGDRPDVDDLAVADDMDPIVKVDRRIAMGREELDALAELHRAIGVGEREPAVLVAGEAVLDAGTLDRLGRERLVGRERLEPGVD